MLLGFGAAGRSLRKRPAPHRRALQHCRHFSPIPPAPARDLAAPRRCRWRVLRAVTSAPAPRRPQSGPMVWRSIGSRRSRELHRNPAAGGPARPRSAAGMLNLQPAGADAVRRAGPPKRPCPDQSPFASQARPAQGADPEPRRPDAGLSAWGAAEPALPLVFWCKWGTRGVAPGLARAQGHAQWAGPCRARAWPLTPLSWRFTGDCRLVVPAPFLGLATPHRHRPGAPGARPACCSAVRAIEIASRKPSVRQKPAPSPRAAEVIAVELAADLEIRMRAEEVLN